MKLAKYLKPYWIFAILAPLTMIGEVFIDLMQPKLMSKIVNDGVIGKDLALILTTGITMLVLVAIGGCFGTLSAAFGSNAAQRMCNDLRNDTFLRRSWGCHCSRPINSLPVRSSLDSRMT